MNWKIVLKVPPNGPASDPVGSPTSLLWGTPVKVKPRQIRDVEEPVVVYDQYEKDPNAHLRCKKGRELSNQAASASAPWAVESLAGGGRLNTCQDCSTEPQFKWVTKQDSNELGSCNINWMLPIYQVLSCALCENIFM